ncbi:putative nuclease [Tripterygium wilfordii]|uniref:Structure-specific endonuclease subunit SLX1 homolog n=1 Tax=Tripterygium wilfordii TaxID=458696 RepID=A0A7J7DDT1_TRIWF|nr:uncharacterized protein LOC120002060 [Tripterygium wilfordii]KAF5744454.1 putative nuclease [Tripterygium wilfordii]
MSTVELQSRVTEMGKRASKNVSSVTLTPEREEEEKGKGFFACYLLTSLCPRFKGHTYIGFTVNPRRRIRQHNGEIRSGAWRTKKRRPWEMVLCLYGFPTNVSALQFEWAWQHPTESLAVRQAAATFKSFSGVANKIKLAYTMLNLPAWQSLNIRANYFSTKYTSHSAGCPSLPEHMKVHVCSMDDLPCYSEGNECVSEGEDNEGCLNVGNEGDEGSKTSQMAKAKMGKRHAGPVDDSTADGSITAGETCADATGVVSVYESCDVDNSYYDKSGILDEYSKREPRDSFTTEGDFGHSFGFIKSLLTTATSVVSSFSMQETAVHGDMIKLVKESIIDLDQPRRQQLSGKETPYNDNQSFHNFSFSREVEVIDLLTPSPGCRIRPCSKKRRVSIVCPEIIDLT